MSAVHREMSAEILSAITAEINATMGTEPAVSVDDVQTALDAALARHFPTGGVLFAWWDPGEGLRMKPTPMPTSGGPYYANRPDSTAAENAQKWLEEER